MTKSPTHRAAERTKKFISCSQENSRLFPSCHSPVCQSVIVIGRVKAGSPTFPTLGRDQRGGGVPLSQSLGTDMAHIPAAHLPLLCLIPVAPPNYTQAGKCSLSGPWKITWHLVLAEWMIKKINESSSLASKHFNSPSETVLKAAEVGLEGKIQPSPAWSYMAYLYQGGVPIEANLQLPRD